MNILSYSSAISLLLSAVLGLLVPLRSLTCYIITVSKKRNSVKFFGSFLPGVFDLQILCLSIILLFCSSINYTTTLFGKNDCDKNEYPVFPVLIWLEIVIMPIYVLSIVVFSLYISTKQNAAFRKPAWYIGDDPDVEESALWKKIFQGTVMLLIVGSTVVVFWIPIYFLILNYSYSTDCSVVQSSLLWFVTSEMAIACISLLVVLLITLASVMIGTMIYTSKLPIRVKQLQNWLIIHSYIIVSVIGIIFLLPELLYRLIDIYNASAIDPKNNFIKVFRILTVLSVPIQACSFCCITMIHMIVVSISDLRLGSHLLEEKPGHFSLSFYTGSKYEDQFETIDLNSKNPTEEEHDEKSASYRLHLRASFEGYCDTLTLDENSVRGMNCYDVEPAAPPNDNVNKFEFV
ncbi:hypothetical protein V1511DRAFT_382093 [Dipodascopsis uninucleata]